MERIWVLIFSILLILDETQYTQFKLLDRLKLPYLSLTEHTTLRRKVSNIRGFGKTLLSYYMLMYFCYIKVPILA